MTKRRSWIVSTILWVALSSTAFAGPGQVLVEGRGTLREWVGRLFEEIRIMHPTSEIKQLQPYAERRLNAWLLKDPKLTDEVLASLDPYSRLEGTDADQAFSALFNDVLSNTRRTREGLLLRGLSREALQVIFNRAKSGGFGDLLEPAARAISFGADGQLIPRTVSQVVGLGELPLEYIADSVSGVRVLDLSSGGIQAARTIGGRKLGTTEGFRYRDKINGRASRPDVTVVRPVEIGELPPELESNVHVLSGKPFETLSAAEILGADGTLFFWSFEIDGGLSVTHRPDLYLGKLYEVSGLGAEHFVKLGQRNSDAGALAGGITLRTQTSNLWDTTVRTVEGVELSLPLWLQTRVKGFDVEITESGLMRLQKNADPFSAPHLELTGRPDLTRVPAVRGFQEIP